MTKKKTKEDKAVLHNAEISRLLYQKVEELDEREAKLDLKQSTLRAWEEKLRQKESNYIKKRQALVGLEVELKADKMYKDFVKNNNSPKGF